MKDLIERLEGLTGPCRECDSLIGKHLFPERDWVAFEENGVDIWWSRCPYEDGAFDGPKPYTASIDAAMTLVPEGWSVHCHFMPREMGNVVKVGTREGEGKTPAIALCIAALKATP